MKSRSMFAWIVALFILSCIPKIKPDFILWNMDNLENIGGYKSTVLGKPDIIDVPNGHALQFDGKDDAILLNTNPISGMGQFTIEIVFRPDRDGNKEQRFFHVQESDDHRVLIETRLTDDNQWFLDTFVKDGASEKTLRAEECLHPVGDWYHVALVYDGKTVSHHVNGIMESKEQVDFHPMQEGQTSIGCRLNRVYWFKGAIQCVRLSGKAIAPDQFLHYEYLVSVDECSLGKPFSIPLDQITRSRL